MNMVDRLVSRTTGTGIVVGLSAGTGLLFGAALALASGEPAMVVSGVVLGAATALLFHTPLRHLMVAVAQIPFSIFVLLPFFVAFWICVKPATWFALSRGWIVELAE